MRSGICKNSQKGALAISSTTPWWNCCGSYTSYTTSGVTGIPGFGPNTTAGMCTQYLKLYARINKPIAFFEDDRAQGTEFYEY